MDLNELRGQIDSIDEQLVKLFSERMKISGRIAEYKTENGLPIYDEKREIEKLAQEPVRTQVLDAAGDAGFLYVSPLHREQQTRERRRPSHFSGDSCKFLWQKQWS